MLAQMVETILRFIMAAIDVALELLVQHTGKKGTIASGPQVEPLYRIAGWSGRLECNRTFVGRGYCSICRETMTRISTR
jgi:hypothetical protein